MSFKAQTFLITFKLFKMINKLQNIGDFLMLHHLLNISVPRDIQTVRNWLKRLPVHTAQLSPHALKGNVVTVLWWE